MGKHLDITPLKAEELVAAYNNAVSNYKLSFNFDDQKLDTKYARYLIEFFQQKMLVIGEFNSDNTFTLKNSNDGNGNY